MTQTTHPSKQLIRDYMDSRTRLDDPSPTSDPAPARLVHVAAEWTARRDGQNEA